MPLKFQDLALKAEYIVLFAREASAPPKQGGREATEEKPEMSLEDKINTEVSGNVIEPLNTISVAPSKKTTTKRGGNERAVAGKQKKRIVSPVTNVSANEKSDVHPAELSEGYDDIDDSDFDSGDEAEYNGPYDDEVEDEKEMEEDSDYEGFIRWQYETPPFQQK